MAAQRPLPLKDFEMLTASVKRGKLDFKYSGEPADTSKSTDSRL